MRRVLLGNSPGIGALISGAGSVNLNIDPVAPSIVFAASVSKLFTSYTGSCVSLRKTSDNSITDVGFDSNGDLDATAVGALGSVRVSRWYNQAIANHLEQSNNAQQPSLTMDTATGGYVLSGGSSSMMESVSNLNLSGKTSVTIYLALHQAPGGSISVLAEQVSAASDGWVLYSNVSGALAAQLGDSVAGAYLINKTSPLDASTPMVIMRTVCDITQATDDDRVALQLGGVDVDEIQHAGSGTIAGGAFQSNKVRVFGKANGTQLTDAEIHSLIIVDGVVSPSDDALIMQFLSSKTATFSNTPAKLDYSRDSFTQLLGTSSAPFARVSYQTDSTRMAVRLNADYPANILQSNIGIFIDGVYLRSEQVVFSPLKSGTIAFNLPSGSKVVTLQNGPANWPGAGDIQGVYIESVRGNRALSRVTANQSDVLCVLGDSISVGASASNMHTEGWTQLMRGIGQQVGVEAYGFRSLYDEAKDAAARTASVQRISQYSPTRLWIALGTNDFSRNEWTPAQLQTGLNTLVQDIHTAMPSVTIFVQSPLIRTDDGGSALNTLGFTVQNYRDAIQAAVNGLGYVTYDNGLSVLLLTDLDDGLHPTTAGHQKLFSHNRIVLGV